MDNNRTTGVSKGTVSPFGRLGSPRTIRKVLGRLFASFLDGTRKEGPRQGTVHTHYSVAPNSMSICGKCKSRHDRADFSFILCFFLDRVSSHPSAPQDSPYWYSVLGRSAYIVRKCNTAFRSRFWNNRSGRSQSAFASALGSAACFFVVLLICSSHHPTIIMAY